MESVLFSHQHSEEEDGSSFAERPFARPWMRRYCKDGGVKRMTWRELTSRASVVLSLPAGGKTGCQEEWAPCWWEWVRADTPSAHLNARFTLPEGLQHPCKSVQNLNTPEGAYQLGVPPEVQQGTLSAGPPLALPAELPRAQSEKPLDPAVLSHPWVVGMLSDEMEKGLEVKPQALHSSAPTANGGAANGGHGSTWSAAGGCWSSVQS